jgi:hypothetical protein
MNLEKQLSGQKQCPNPWTTLFITENGDISICFLSEPVGNLYEMPLVEIWNCPKAVAKRSRMLAGRYTASGCSKLWCDWRDGKVTDPPDPESWRELLELFQELRKLVAIEIPPAPDMPQTLRAYRRLMLERERRIKELESNLALLWDNNGVLHAAGQRHIQHLEGKAKELESKLGKLRDKSGALQATGQRHINHLEEKIEGFVQHLARAKSAKEAVKSQLAEKVATTKLSDKAARKEKEALLKRLAAAEEALAAERTKMPTRG